MAIEIEIRGASEESHQEKENISWYVYCYSCPSVNEENGDYGPPPLELSWINTALTLEQIITQCEEHLASGNKNHHMVISGLISSDAQK